LRFLKFLLLVATIGWGGELAHLYKTKQYREICKNRWKYINLYRGKNEPLLSWVAYSCLKIGNIVPALDVAKNLYATPEGRSNATYIATLFLIKKLVYQLIKDNLTFTNIKLPIIKGDPLGEAFKEIVKGNFKRVDNSTILVADGRYKITALPNGNLKVEIFKNGNFIRKELYW